MAASQYIYKVNLQCGLLLFLPNRLRAACSELFLLLLGYGRVDIRAILGVNTQQTAIAACRVLFELIKIYWTKKVRNEVAYIVETTG